MTKTIFSPFYFFYYYFYNSVLANFETHNCVAHLSSTNLLKCLLWSDMSLRWFFFVPICSNRIFNVRSNLAHLFVMICCYLILPARFFYVLIHKMVNTITASTVTYCDQSLLQVTFGKYYRAAHWLLCGNDKPVG